MKEKKPKIKVETLPNGYALTVDNEEYLYFTAKQLIAGVFHHIGLGKLDYINTEHVESLMEAILSWPSIKEAATSQANIMADLRETRKDLYTTRRYNVELQTKMKNMEDDARDLRSQLYMSQMRTSSDKDLASRLADALESINKLNRHNVKLEHERHEQDQTIAALKRELAKYVKRAAKKAEKPKQGATTKPGRKKHVRGRKIADAMVMQELEKQQQDKNQ